MKNLNDDTEFENYLREFRPVAGRPLPSRRPASFAWAATCAAVIALVALAILGHRHVPSDRQGKIQALLTQPAANERAHALTLGQLNAAARQGDQALESALDRSASAALPRMDKPNTVLSALSGE